MKFVLSLICACFLADAALAQSPVTVAVNTLSPGLAVPTNFLGLSFETGNLQYNGVGVNGYMFDSSNAELVTLFTNLGIKSVRIGGISVDRDNGMIPLYVPTNQDIDALFRFATAADVNVIFSLRLANGDPLQDAAIAGYTWTNYNQHLTCFAIGNEPDGYPAGTDPAITNFSSYLIKWNSFADTITNSVPQAKFGGLDGAGTGWVAEFANAERGSKLMVSIFSHEYVGGNSGSLTASQIISNMLSQRWDTTSYPNQSNATEATVNADGFPYRLTEFNSYVAPYPGLWGGNNSFASALFALDGAHWWAENGALGVNFHTYLGKYNATIFYDANGNYQIFPIAYGMKAFDLGGHGNVEPVSLLNTNGLNLTAYAVDCTTNLFVTILDREYGANARDAAVTIAPFGLVGGSAEVMFLVATNGGAAATNDITLGGASITNNAPWQGQWTALSPPTNGQCVLTVPASSTAIVKISGVWSFPPVITQDLPLRVLALTGESYQYSIGVESMSPLSYQWYQGTTPLAGQTNATYTATAGSPGTNTYSVVITNIYGAVTSSVSTFVSFAPSTTSLATTIQQFNPAGYWPMHEVEAPAPGDIETNYGTLGPLGEGFYPDWAGALAGITRGVSGALANDSDTAVNFTRGGKSGSDTPAGLYTNALYVPHTSHLTTLVPPFSVECWFYPTNVNSQDIWDQDGYEGLNAGGVGGGVGSLGGIRLVWLNGTNTGFEIYTLKGVQNNVGFTGSTSTNTSPLNNWYHLVVTCDANTNISIYTNGVQAPLNNIGGTPVNSPASYTPDYWTPIAIGGGRGGTRSVSGYIDEFAVYTNVIGDISMHYNDGISGPAGRYFHDVTNDHPVIYLRMDAPAAYTPPPLNIWPLLMNYGSAGGSGYYTPGTIPGILPGPVSPTGVSYTGVTNDSALFSGVSSFADAGSAPAFNPTGSNANFIVLALFRGFPCDGRVQTIVGHGTNSWQLSVTTNGCLAFNAGNGHQTSEGTGQATGDITTIGAYNDGDWHQVVAVNQTNVVSIYVDGVLDTSGTPGGIAKTSIIPGNTSDVMIGSDPSYTNNPAGVGRSFAGQICDVAFFTNALTAGDIEAIYLSASTPPPETLTLAKAATGQLQLNWNYGTLQTATNVAGPYQDLTNASSPYEIVATNSQQYFRVKENLGL